MDQLIDSTTSTSYSLTLRIAADGFSLSVFDQNKTLMSSKEVAAAMYSLLLDEIVKLFESEIQLNCHNVQIVVESEQYAIIPTDIFKINEAIDFLRLEHNPTKADSILYNKIPIFDIVNIFAIPGTIHNALNYLFPNSVIEHHITSFILASRKTKNLNCIHVLLRNKRFDVLVIKDSIFQLINSISFQTPEDFCFFTLNIFDKLSLDIQKCPVYVFNGDSKPELVKMLEKYVVVNTL